MFGAENRFKAYRARQALDWVQRVHHDRELQNAYHLWLRRVRSHDPRVCQDSTRYFQALQRRFRQLTGQLLSADKLLKKQLAGTLRIVASAIFDVRERAIR